MSPRDNAHRSFRRYVAMLLGEPWQLRMERRSVDDEDLPAGAVELGAQRTTGTASVDQSNRTTTLPVTVTLYPVVAENARAGRHDADLLVERLDALISVGLDLGDDANGRPVAGPYRFPLWDYTDVDLEGPDRAGPPDEETYGRGWVDRGHAVNAVQDPLDEKRWTVTLEATLSWESAGRDSSIGAPLVRAAPGTWAGEPG